MTVSVTESALTTVSLGKRFGSLIVANDIGLCVPKGARHALIGPNGAGKTTLINMITGAVKPDSGAILLGSDDITKLKPWARVKKGIARTFQITTLFPHLSALEAVTLAVCERRGLAGKWWRSLAAYEAAVQEAYDILASLRLSDDCTRETHMLAYGQQRLLEIALALATRPSVLLLDEPAAGIPRGESAELLTVIANLPEDITVLFIEHDMNLVFRFATRIVVLVGGTVLTEGTPKEIASDARVREVYLGGAHQETARD
jgi:branched-chain amino acid transport system ATP-binding protein